MTLWWRLYGLYLQDISVEMFNYYWGLSEYYYKEINNLHTLAQYLSSGVE